MTQGKVSRAVAVKTLRKHNGDIVNAIMVRASAAHRQMDRWMDGCHTMLISLSLLHSSLSLSLSLVRSRSTGAYGVI